MTSSIDFNGFPSLTVSKSPSNHPTTSSSIAILNNSGKNGSSSSDLLPEKEQEMSQLASLTAAATSALEGVGKGKAKKRRRLYKITLK